MALGVIVVIESSSDAEYQSLRGVLADLVAQLRAADPADFGRVARRSSVAGENAVRYLWQRHQAFDSMLEATSDDEERTQQFATTTIRDLIQGWISWAYECNQFFEFDSPTTRRLEQIHRDLMASIDSWLRRAQSLEVFARQVHLAYIRYAERLGRCFRHLVRVGGVGGRGAEYSAELQLELLGLKDHAWREPIVDLGCGADAILVQQLRHRGLAATGIERRCGAEHVIQSDWFNVRFEPESLGTIISHLGFSLQFLHHHWQSGDRAYDYARKYMELLASLVPGGLFCYAPGLPFIEDMLDASRYEVKTLPLPAPLDETIGSLRDIGTGRSVAYACQVRRR